MINATRHWLLILISAVLGHVAALTTLATGAAAEPGVPLDVFGRVLRIYSSDDPAGDARLVELELRSVALKESGAAPAVRLPAPGEVVFIVVDELRGRLAGQGVVGHRFPSAGDLIRGTIHHTGRGVWAAIGPDWITSLTPGNDAAAGRDAASREPMVELRGMSCKLRDIDGRLGLEVAAVKARSPAHDAGFEVGDVVIALDGKPIRTAAQVTQQAQGPGELQLSVVDVNSGRVARVPLAPAPAGSIQPPRPDAARSTPAPDAAERIAAALGISVEATGAGRSSGVKVTSVERLKSGAEAGLEPGDVIVAIGKMRVADADEFAQALPAQGGAITLIVRDVRSGEEVPIAAQAQIVRSTARRTEPKADPAATREGAPDRLGLTTELDFYKAEAAVRIVAVKPGSPADLAGVPAGWLILKADDVPIMHPDDLAQAEAAATRRITLRVVDPQTDRQTSIPVGL